MLAGIAEQFPKRDRLDRTLFDKRRHGANHMKHVVQKQAKSKLKHAGLRRAANEVLKAEYLSHLLEDSLDVPAQRVQIQHVSCRIGARGERANSGLGAAFSNVNTTGFGAGATVFPRAAMPVIEPVLHGLSDVSASPTR